MYLTLSFDAILSVIGLSLECQITVGQGRDRGANPIEKVTHEPLPGKVCISSVPPAENRLFWRVFPGNRPVFPDGLAPKVL
jgi:hypothetical protein